MHCLVDISNRADLQISETFSVRWIKDVPSETSLRSLRFCHRHLRVTSESVISGCQTEAFFDYASLKGNVRNFQKLK